MSTQKNYKKKKNKKIQMLIRFWKIKGILVKLNLDTNKTLY